MIYIYKLNKTLHKIKKRTFKYIWSHIWIWQESFQTDTRVVQSFNQLSNQQGPVSSKLMRRVDIKLQKPSSFSVKQSRT